MFSHDKQNIVPQTIPSGVHGGKADKKGNDDPKDKPVFSNPSLEAKRKRALELLAFGTGLERLSRSVRHRLSR